MEHLTVHKITNDVTSYLKVPKSQLNRKTKPVSMAKHIIMWLARTWTPLGVTKIGSEMGGLDHSSVLYGWNRVEEARFRQHELIKPVTDYFMEHYTTLYGKPEVREAPATPGLAEYSNYLHIADALNKKLNAEGAASRLLIRLFDKVGEDKLRTLLHETLGTEGVVMMNSIKQTVGEVAATSGQYYATLAISNPSKD